jgi:hypothetical protein
MTRYFFHIWDDGARLDDPEGSELDDLKAAREEAIQGAREMICQAVLHGYPIRLGRRFEIVNAAGESLATIPFSEAIIQD